MCVGGGILPHGDGFHATFLGFNVGMCFKDAPGPFVAAFFFCTCFLSVTLMTHQLLVTTLLSVPNLENSTRGFSGCLQYFSVLQPSCRLFPKMRF